MAQEFAWRDGERVMFLGDSITEDPEGYTRLVPAMVTARYPELRIGYWPRGVGGNRIGDLYERLERDIFGGAPMPTWIGLSIGINDVMHGQSGTPLGRFHELYGSLLEALNQTGARVACMTTTVIGEELDNEANQLLAGYNDAIREQGFTHGAQVIDVNRIFRDAISRGQTVTPDFRYTIDGIRLNTYGDYLLAMTILRAIHFALPGEEPQRPGMEHAA